MKNKSMLKVMGEEKEKMGESAMRGKMSQMAMHGRRGNTPMHKTRRFGHN